MNRKQEIAAWIFGLLIAVGLLVTDNGIWALVVIAALTLLSLRDRHKKKQSTVEARVRENTNEVVTSPANGPGLKNVTPHLLATVLLQRRAEGATPFRAWRDAEVQIPPRSDEIIAIACEFYQLRIFLDLLQRRFGSGIAKLVEASFQSIIDDVNGLGMFSRVSDAILSARAIGPADDGPDNVELKVDVQVADQYLKIYSDSDKEFTKAELRMPLAQCLSYARIAAQQVFSGLMPLIDFDPMSVIAVSRETKYTGTSNRWSERPGCFERHLQRKEDNLLFPVDERRPTEEAIHEARAKDEAELQLLDQEMKALLQKAGRFGEQETVAAGVLLNFLQHEIDPLMRRASAVGESGMWVFTNLSKLRDALFETIAQKPDVKVMVEDLKSGLEGQFNPFLAQTWRDDTPIKTDEIAPALLCESTDTVKEALELFQRTTPETVRMLNEQSTELLKYASAQGFLLPGAEEKLSLLKQCSESLKSTV